ncbi:MAG: tetratricopeptide repeat protein [Candidatus Hydrogenedentes bacterium]|nr:tetratricopeptide repeat protein [Candidatus Hydrogenedentota bacterium]
MDTLNAIDIENLSITYRPARRSLLLCETYLFLARSYEELGDYDRAVQTAEAGLAQVPGYTLLRVEKRIAARKRGWE